MRKIIQLQTQFKSQNIYQTSGILKVQFGKAKLSFDISVVNNTPIKIQYSIESSYIEQSASRNFCPTKTLGKKVNPILFLSLKVIEHDLLFRWIKY